MSQEASEGTAIDRLNELLEAERSLVGVQETLAEARIARETNLAGLEELAGVDVETLNAGRAAQEGIQDGAQAVAAARPGGEQP